MAPTTKMGYENKVYIGTAGSTAATLVENAIDIDYDMAPSYGSTTVRGTSAAPPIETQAITGRKGVITWKMLSDSSDTALTTLLAAATAGDGIVAVRYLDVAANKGYDGDCVISAKESAPLNGESTWDITATPARGYGRTPQIWV